MDSFLPPHTYLGSWQITRFGEYFLELVEMLLFILTYFAHVQENHCFAGHIHEKHRNRFKVRNPGNVEEILSQGKQAKAHPTEPNTTKAEVLLPGNPDALFIVEVRNRLCSSYRNTSALNPSRSRWGVEEQQQCLRRPRRSRGGGGSHSSDRLSIASPSSVRRCTGNFTSNPTQPRPCSCFSF